MLGLSCRIFSCGMWDLIPWPVFEPGPPVLGVQHLSHLTTREVPPQNLLPAGRSYHSWGGENKGGGGVLPGSGSTEEGSQPQEPQLWKRGYFSWSWDDGNKTVALETSPGEGEKREGLREMEEEQWHLPFSCLLFPPASFHWEIFWGSQLAKEHRPYRAVYGGWPWGWETIDK